jgi:glycosyltransferase involved in cell wall biosynthesis
VRIVGGLAAAGDDDYLAHLQALVAESGLQAFVAFPGAVSFNQLRDEYLATDLFVNCKTASMDKVVLEAAACGSPVVAASPAFAQLGEMAHAPVVFPADNAEALAGQMAQVAALAPGERQAIGMRLAAVVEREYSVHRLMEKLADTLNHVAHPPLPK